MKAATRIIYNYLIQEETPNTLSDKSLLVSSRKAISINIQIKNK